MDQTQEHLATPKNITIVSGMFLRIITAWKTVKIKIVQADRVEMFLYMH